ncbi:MAG: lipid A-modifier LpxR family protein [Myxococcota bacterium]
MASLMLVSLAIGTFIATSTPADDRSTDAGRLSLDLINDAWATGQDEGFSSRFRLVARYAPFIGSGISGLFPDRWPVVAEYWSMGAQFDLYTPTDLTADTLEELQDERPYAGYISGTIGADFVFHDSPIIEEGYSSFTTTIEVGVVGPQTGAGDFQREWHRIIRELLNRNFTPRDPRGWGIWEIPNAVLFSLRARYETEAFRTRWPAPRLRQRRGSEPQAQLSGFLDCSLGTLRVSCDYGVNFRFGLMPDIALEGALPISSWSAANGRPRRPFAVYLLVGLGGDVVAYDAFLDGPVGIEESPSQTKRVAGASGQAGFVLRFRRFEMFYRHMLLTREVREVPQPRGVDPQQLGQFILSYTWD